MTDRSINSITLPSDAAAILALFKDTIRRVNSRNYVPEQIRAWASDEIDHVAWAQRFGSQLLESVFAEARARSIMRLYLEASIAARGVCELPDGAAGDVIVHTSPNHDLFERSDLVVAMTFIHRRIAGTFNETGL